MKTREEAVDLALRVNEIAREMGAKVCAEVRGDHFPIVGVLAEVTARNARRVYGGHSDSDIRHLITELVQWQREMECGRPEA